MTDITDSAVTLEDAPTRRLERVDDGRWLGGVSEGLGRYFDISPLVYRIAFVALAFVGGAGLLLYLAAFLVIPHETREDSIAVEALRERREQPWLLIGVGLLAFGALLTVSEADFWPGADDIWLLAAITGASLVAVQVAERRGDRKEAVVDEEAGTAATPRAPRPAPKPRPPRRPSLFLPVIGALLAGAAILGLLDETGVVDVSLTLAFAAGLAIVGGAIAVGAATDYRVGALVPVGILLLLGFAASAVSPVGLSTGIGDEVARPLDAAALERTYDHGIGELTVDLSNVDLPPGRTEVDVELGIGHAVVTVPDGVGLDIDAHAGAGEVRVLERSSDGTDVDERVVVPAPTPGGPVLVLEADVGFGDLEVRRD
jgi:phage shock protein PspC (stress-responsive transcriptional regulator)